MGQTRGQSEWSGDLTLLSDTNPTPTRRVLLGQSVVHGGERVLHGAGGLVAHARHYVGVGVQRYRHCGVTQELLDEFGVGPFT